MITEAFRRTKLRAIYNAHLQARIQWIWIASTWWTFSGFFVLFYVVSIWHFVISFHAVCLFVGRFAWTSTSFSNKPLAHIHPSRSDQTNSVHHQDLEIERNDHTRHNKTWNSRNIANIAQVGTVRLNQKKKPQRLLSLLFFHGATTTTATTFVASTKKIDGFFHDFSAECDYSLQVERKKFILDLMGRAQHIFFSRWYCCCCRRRRRRCYNLFMDIVNCFSRQWNAKMKP